MQVLSNVYFGQTYMYYPFGWSLNTTTNTTIFTNNVMTQSVGLYIT